MLNESIQLFSLGFGRRAFRRVFGPVFDRVSRVLCLGVCLLLARGVIHVQGVCSFVNVSKSFCNLLLFQFMSTRHVLNESIQLYVLGLVRLGLCLGMCL